MCILYCTYSHYTVSINVPFYMQYDKLVNYSSFSVEEKMQLKAKFKELKLSKSDFDKMIGHLILICNNYKLSKIYLSCLK